jgi:hypothetical protein
MSILLSITATKFTVSEHIPRVHYRTLFDEYLLGTAFFVFVVLVSSQFNGSSCVASSSAVAE